VRKLIVLSSFLFAACLVGVSTAGAQTPAVVGPRAIIVDPTQDKVLFEKAPDSRALQGSIAKLMTAFVTSRAVKDGLASWDDTVTLTPRDAIQGCTCMQSVNNLITNTNPPPPQICSATSATQAGQKFKLKELLQVTLNQSTGESTDAIAEFIARKVLNQPAPHTQADSEHLMDLFVGLMNKRAHELHLDHSTFVTVHGGDTCDFATGCDPHCEVGNCHPENCPQGSQCGGGTTVRDLTTLWDTLVKDEPLFFSLIGVRAFALDQADKDATFFNSYGHGYGYYAGINGDKNGGSGACPAISCWMAQSTRGGHPLVSAVLQSFVTNNSVTPPTTTTKAPSDLATMFRWAYGYVLAPRRVVDSGNQETETASDHAIACNQGQCFTAIRTQSDTLGLIAWNVSIDQAILERLTTFSPAPGGPGNYSKLSAVDVAANQFGTVVAMVTDGNVVVGDWQLTGGPSGPVPNVHLTFGGDTGNQGGTGSLVRVGLMGDSMALTAVRADDGTIRLSSWKIGFSAQPTQTTLSRLANGSSSSAPNLGTTGELQLAVGPDPKNPGKDFVAMTAAATATGSASVQSWRIDGTTGSISFLKNFLLNGARNISIANNGVGKFGLGFTNGSASTGTVQVETLDVDRAGTITPTLNMADSSSDLASATVMAPLGPAAKSAGIKVPTPEPTTTNTFNTTKCGANFAPVAPQSQGDAAAFLSGVARTSGATLAAWDSPVFFTEDAVVADRRLADSGSAWGKASSIRIAAIDTENPLKNQYVTQQMRSDGTLLLIGWGTGKATPPLPKPTKTATPKATPVKVGCPPCVCPNGFKAGPAACAGSVACQHICLGHGG